MPAPAPADKILDPSDLQKIIGPTSDHPLLTQRFYRTGKSRSGGIQGSGLGLAFVDEIVTRYAGRLQIESRVGIGTTVSFALPLGRHSGGILIAGWDGLD